MIVTVTPNVAIDRTYGIDRIQPGQVHKIRSVSAKVGGKGINVSRVLSDLGLAPVRPRCSPACASQPAATWIQPMLTRRYQTSA